MDGDEPSTMRRGVPRALVAAQPEKRALQREKTSKQQQDLSRQQNRHDQASSGQSGVR